MINHVIHRTLTWRVIGKSTWRSFSSCLTAIRLHGSKAEPRLLELPRDSRISHRYPLADRLIPLHGHGREKGSAAPTQPTSKYDR
ncbi:hypothetical protein B296_00036111 [Ensete ventricosum]|uniref:Uncharacterized protein n=1 Tax=Ensete ventricosum TaxID=4639 RepID=A0A426XGI6_ENSVE|nr:hypothetical protein B296_00036111 [Ensete ventricosum]